MLQLVIDSSRNDHLGARRPASRSHREPIRVPGIVAIIRDAAIDLDLDATKTESEADRRAPGPALMIL